MAHSQRIRLADLRRVFHLSGECRELGSDPLAWRGHMLSGVCQMVGARVGITGCYRTDERGRADVLQCVDMGWESTDERQAFHRWLNVQGLETEPVVRRVEHMPGRLITRSREQLIDDHEWYTALHHDFRFPCRIDHCIMSFYRPAQGPVSSISIHRTLGDKPFTRRERCVIHLLHEELGPQIGLALAGVAEPSTGDLSPRLKQTLRHLLAGASEKEAAARIGLSGATVHEYVTAIYRHFGVCSRAELLAYWLTRGRRPPASG